MSWAQDVLRLFCYVGGGYSASAFPFYYGYPMLIVGVILGSLLEGLDKSKPSSLTGGEDGRD